MHDGPPIRLPAYMVGLISKWRTAEAVLTDRLGRAPTPDEIGKALRLSKKKVGIVARALEVNALSRAGEAGEAEDGVGMEVSLADDRVHPCDEGLDEADQLGRIYARIDTLDDREALVVRMRFGLAPYAPRTLREVGEELGLTRERVRQIERLAMARLVAAVVDDQDAGQ